MVKIILKLYLAKDAYTKEILLDEVEVKGLSLKEVLTSIGLSLEDVGLIVVNGQWQNSEYIVKEGDTIELFPNVLGG